MRHALFLAGIFGFLGVALGAFGAHGLEGWLADAPDGAKRLAWWHTGVQYQLWHALLLLGVGLWPSGGATQPLRIASWLVVAGVVLFSGSLYTMTITDVRVLGAVTPFGGLAFLGAWTCVAWAALRR